MISPNENAPDAANIRGANSNHNPSRLQKHSSAPVDLLLSRLEGIRQVGKGWRARCPAHGSKRNQTLSISAGEDGRVLIYCFALCEPMAIVHALGLELSDLYEKRINADMTPAQQRQLRQQATQSQWAAALEVLNLEARIVAVAADQIAQAEPLNDPDRDRLGLALERITGARLVLNGR